MARSSPRSAGMASPCSTAAARVGGLDLGLVPGEGGQMSTPCRAAPDGKLVVICSAPTSSRWGGGSAFVIYQGSMATAAPTAPTSSCPAPPIPRRTHLRQHRRTGADDGARGLPARRGARGLDHPQGSVRRARPDSCLSTPARLRAAMFAAIRIWLLDLIDFAPSPAMEGLARSGGDREGAVPPGGRGFLSDQSDRAGIGRDGRCSALARRPH